MSETLNSDGKYPDLPLTNFPASVDVWQECLDVTAALLPQVNQYAAAMASGDYAAAQAILEDDSTGMLQRMIVNADTINRLQQALTAIERMWDTDIKDYIEGGYLGDYYTKTQVDTAIESEATATREENVAAIEAEATRAKQAEQENSEEAANAQNAANTAQDSANAARGVADAAMPKSGGMFTGFVLAPWSNRQGPDLKNADVFNSDAVTRPSVMSLTFIRK